ncbi:MAG: hypothetical protein DWH73_00255, partial [Planctomycetota bacterium]
MMRRHRPHFSSIFKCVLITLSLLVISSLANQSNAQDEARAARSAEDRGEQPRSMDDRLTISLF